MSRFKRLSHVIWHCQYHIIWVPKYQFRILKGPVAEEVYNCIQVFCAQLKCEIIELNVRPDHIHQLLFVPPKVAISVLMGTLKGRTAIRIFKKFGSSSQRVGKGVGVVRKCLPSYPVTIGHPP